MGMGSPSTDGQGSLGSQGGQSGEQDPQIACTMWRCPLAQGGDDTGRQAAAISDETPLGADGTSSGAPSGVRRSGESQFDENQRGSSDSSYGVETFMVNRSGKIMQHMIFVQFAEKVDIDPAEMFTVDTAPVSYIGADVERIIPPPTNMTAAVSIGGGGGGAVNPPPAPARVRRQSAAFAEALALEIGIREKIKEVRLAGPLRFQSNAKRDHSQSILPPISREARRRSKCWRRRRWRKRGCFEPPA